MKKSYWFEMIFVILGCVLIFIGAWFGGMSFADARARESVLNEDATELIELAVEHDYDAEIKEAYYNYEKGIGYYLVQSNSKPEWYYTIRIKVKKIAPFRYEWVEDITQ